MVSSGDVSIRHVAELTDLGQEPSRQQKVHKGGPQGRQALGTFKDARGQCGRNTRKERDCVAEFRLAEQGSQTTPRILLRELEV